MSKFLAQSKTFLPMVMQKSTTDAIQILEKYPALSTAQHEELPKQETPKQETSKHEMQNPDPPKIEPLPLHQEILKQISSVPKENLKIVLNQSPEIPVIDSCKVSEASKVPVTVVLDKGPESLNVVTVDSGNDKTLLRALILDLVQIHRRLVVLLSEGRVWLWQQVLSDRVGPGDTSMIRMEQPKLKESEPVPVLSMAHKKKQPKIKEEEEEEEKSEEKPPIKSNLWEAIQENSPAWQRSISNQLGELQKVIVEKLSK